MAIMEVAVCGGGTVARVVGVLQSSRAMVSSVALEFLGEG